MQQTCMLHVLPTPAHSTTRLHVAPSKFFLFSSSLPAIRQYSEGRGIWFTVCLFVCLFVRQRFLDNPRADSRQSSHAGVLWFRMCLLPFWGLEAPGGRKKGQMKFSLLWESMGNFCILAVFERYLSNACTDPHQILQQQPSSYRAIVLMNPHIYPIWQSKKI